eukprot:2920940-Ditylum_brightwellii.AAC.1
MMHNAKLHRHLSPSQYGGRKGRSAIDIPALSEQAAGLSPEKSIFFEKTLKNLEYQLSTAYEPSTEKNYHSVQHPVHGIGQEPTDGPPKWTCTVNTALRCYDKKAKGALIKDPTGKISTQKTGYNNNVEVAREHGENTPPRYSHSAEENIRR